MKQYSVTSKGFDGQLIFKYDEQDKLSGFDLQATLTDEHREWVFNALPRTVAKLQGWAKNSKTIKIMEIPLDLSFDTFWNAYGQAYGAKVGDKKKAEKLWKAMTEAERAKALTNIQPYKLFAKNKNYDMVYPERYLSKGYYDNTYTIAA